MCVWHHFILSHKGNRLLLWPRCLFFVLCRRACFQYIKAYFQYIRAYFQHVRAYFQHLRAYFQYVRAYFQGISSIWVVLSYAAARPSFPTLFFLFFLFFLPQGLFLTHKIYVIIRGLYCFMFSPRFYFYFCRRAYFQYTACILSYVCNSLLMLSRNIYCPPPNFFHLFCRRAHFQHIRCIWRYCCLMLLRDNEYLFPQIFSFFCSFDYFPIFFRIVFSYVSIAER